MSMGEMHNGLYRSLVFRNFGHPKAGIATNPYFDEINLSCFFVFSKIFLFDDVCRRT